MFSRIYNKGSFSMIRYRKNVEMSFRCKRDLQVPVPSCLRQDEILKQFHVDDGLANASLRPQHGAPSSFE